MQAATWLPRGGLARVVLFAAIAFFLLMIWWPISQTFWLSFWDQRPGVQRWVGLENYRTLLFVDTVFWKSLSVTFWYVGLTVPGVVVFGLLLAVALDGLKNLTVRGFFTSLYFVPYIVPLVAVALVWRYMYLPGNQGLFNVILGTFDLGPVRWLNSTDWALPSLAILRIWKISGYAMVLFMAGLQSIPAVYYEAASIDGANAWQRFMAVTWPVIRNITLISTLLSIIWTFADFQLVYVLTKGGPANSTHIFGTYSYQTLGYTDIGTAAAISLYMFPILAVLAIILLRYVRHED